MTEMSSSSEERSSSSSSSVPVVRNTQLNDRPSQSRTQQQQQQHNPSVPTAITADGDEPRWRSVHPLSPKNASMASSSFRGSSRMQAIRLTQQQGTRQRPPEQGQGKNASLLNDYSDTSKNRLSQSAARTSTGRRQDMKVSKGLAVCDNPAHVERPEMNVVADLSNSSETPETRMKRQGTPAGRPPSSKECKTTAYERTDLSAARSYGTLSRAGNLPRVVRPGAAAVDGPATSSDATTMDANSNEIPLGRAATSNDDEPQTPQAIGAFLVDDSSGQLAARMPAGEQEGEDAIGEEEEAFVAVTTGAGLDVEEANAAAATAAPAASDTSAAAPYDRKKRRVIKLVLIYCVVVLLPVVILSTVIALVWGGEKRKAGGPSQAGVVSSTSAPASSELMPSAQPPPTAPTGQQRTSGASACIGGWYYYTYESGAKIGAIDVTSGSTSNQYISTPDCTLQYLTFDDAGTAYGHCYYGDLNITLVTVDLASGRTTALAHFPQYPTTSGYYFGLAFNPANGYFYTTVRWFPPPNPMMLVRIDPGKDNSKNWTFTSIGSALDHTLTDFAIDSTGTAIGIVYGTAVHSVDLAEGTLSYMGDLTSNHYSIAFDGTDTLYGIGADPPGPLSLLGVAPLTTTHIKDTLAPNALGGAFCPFA